MLQKKKKNKLKRKREKENREKKKGKRTKKEKKKKRKKNKKKIADQVNANGPAHRAWGVRRGAKRRPDRSIAITTRGLLPPTPRR
jgi:hypothetical protein